MGFATPGRGRTFRRVGGRSKASRRKNSQRKTNSALARLHGKYPNKSTTITAVVAALAMKSLQRKTDYASMAAFARSMGKDLAVRVGGKTLGNLRSPSSTGKVGKKNTTPYAYDTESSMINVANQFRERVTSCLETGYPSSRSVNLAEKINGSDKITLFDTLTRANLQGLRNDTLTALPRATLSHSYGFNSRNVHMLPAASYVTHLDLWRALNGFAFPTADADLPESDNSDQKVYASFQEALQEIKIYNQSTFFPMRCKIHIIDAQGRNQNGQPQRNISVETFGSTGVAKSGAIPNGYLHSSSQLEGSAGVPESTSLTVDVSRKGGNPFKMSSYFNENYRVVKTISQKIMPNGTWVFKHKHHFGPGLDWEQIRQNMKTIATGAVQPLEPTSYMYAIETTGFDCEGILNSPDGTKPSYIGSNPGWYNIEFKKAIKYVRPPATTGDFAANLGFNPKVHIRAFTTSSQAQELGSIENKEFFRLPDQISQQVGTNVLDNTIYVPVVTDKRIRAAGKANGTDEDI